MVLYKVPKPAEINPTLGRGLGSHYWALKGWGLDKVRNLAVSVPQLEDTLLGLFNVLAYVRLWAHILRLVLLVA